MRYAPLLAIAFLLVACATPREEPRAYEYQHEIFDAAEGCTIDKRLRLNVSIDAPLNELEQAQLATFMRCAADHIPEYLNSRGAEGWRLLSFEALPTPAGSFPTLHYRLVWERPRP